jgi:hypothetical protein
VYEAIAVATKLGSQITVVVPDVIGFLHATCETSIKIHGEHMICSIFDPEDGNTVLYKRYLPG